MRTVLTRLLTTVGVLLLTCGLLAGVVNRELLDGDRFAQHVDAVRTDPDVSRALGIRISDEVIAQQPELVALRPLLEAGAANLVASPALGPIVRSTVAPLHRALVSGESDQVLLRLADVGAVLVAAVQALDPDTSLSLPENLDVTLADFGAQEGSKTLIEAAHFVSVLAWLLPLLGVVALLGAGLVRGGGARSLLASVQHGLYWSAGTLVVLLFVVGAWLGRMDTSTLGNALVHGVWLELDGSLWVTAGVVTAVAVVVAAVGHPAFTAGPGAWARALDTWYSMPNPTVSSRLTRGGVLLALAAALVLEPLAVVAGVVGLIGVLAGARALGDVAVAALQFLADRAPRFVGRVRSWVTSRTAIVVGLAVVAALLVVGAWPRDTTLPQALGTDRSCNGSIKLCDRAYDDVRFVATHNSMSAADGAGWFLAEQPTGVTGQLADGVRVFLIDAWPGQSTAQDGIIANSEASRADGMAQATEAFGADVVQAALRLRGALNLTPEGPIRPYLCHALCELGSTDWTEQMRQVRDWLDTHPREVLTFYIEDYVTPQQTGAVFADAGMEDVLFTPPADGSWPTLGEMIDSGKRVVVFGQSFTDPKLPWLMHGQGLVQDTPFTFTSDRQFTAAEDFSCEHNRGPADAPLFMVNHWLSNYTSRVADGKRVNARNILLPRIEACEEQRGQVVNYVAINNYDLGDAFKVVNELNGV